LAHESFKVSSLIKAVNKPLASGSSNRFSFRTRRRKMTTIDTRSINEQIILAVFTAGDEDKVKALDILQGKEVRMALSGPLLLTMGEATDLLGVSRATLWRMIGAGVLEKVEIYPGSYRLRVSDILELVEKRKPAKPQEAWVANSI
jgi:excisionase family DNA binding protein